MSSNQIDSIKFIYGSRIEEAIVYVTKPIRHAKPHMKILVIHITKAISYMNGFP